MRKLAFRSLIVASGMLLIISWAATASADELAWRRYLVIRTHLERESTLSAARWDNWRARHGNGAYQLATYNTTFPATPYRPFAPYEPVYPLSLYDYGPIYDCHRPIRPILGEVHAGPAHVYYGRHGSVDVGPIHVRW